MKIFNKDISITRLLKVVIILLLVITVMWQNWDRSHLRDIIRKQETQLSLCQFYFSQMKSF